MAQTHKKERTGAFSYPKTSDGQPQATSPWTDQVYARLERFAERTWRRFPGVRSNDEAGDILHTALVRVLKALDKLGPLPEEQFIALAVARIRWEFLDAATRYRGPEWQFTHGANASRPGEKPQTEWDVEESAEFTRFIDDWTAFHESVEHLPPVEREVVSLLFYHRWTQEEVADLFQVSVRTIRERWKWALRELEAAAKQG